MAMNNTAKQKDVATRGIKLVIFDLGGVVINYSEDLYVKKLSKETGAPAEKISRLLMRLDPLFDSGKISLKEFESKMAKSLKISKSSVKWAESFYELSSLNMGTYRIMRKLRKRYKVVILSNISMPRYYASLKIIRKDCCERYFASCFLHMRKPERRIYMYVLGKMSAKPEEAVFIDNLRRNVRGAEAAGLKGILFKNAKKLEADLRKLRLRLD